MYAASVAPGSSTAQRGMRHPGRSIFLRTDACLLLPLACVGVCRTRNLHESRSLFIYILHFLVPVLRQLWMLAHLQIGMDSDGEEALYACWRKQEWLLRLLCQLLSDGSLCIFWQLYYDRSPRRS
ncbi:MAG: hypothetical protein QM296_02745 [Bacillota bacterium]|nr:hypothetical protein [Bacillota bacterium]